MKKLNFFKAFAALSLLVASAFFVSCSNDDESHEHTFATAWSNDATHHWHAATCEHTDQVKDKAEHTFGEWTVAVAPTEATEGIKYKECSECHYSVVETIAKLDHTHTFATAYTSDATHHWHAATCGHTTEVKDKAEHTFGEWTSNDDATVTSDGTKSRICSICQYRETVADEGTKITPTVTRLDDNFVKITGVPIKGTETWTPSSSVFVTGRELTIPSLVVCDHEVTRGEYKELMKIDLKSFGYRDEWSYAYDKDGNSLNVDESINNPMGRVSWYAAIAYCNKLSLKENLAPCYSVDGIDDWENLEYNQIPSTNDDTWNAVTCNFEANGYRLPTEAEWEWLARGGENYTYAGSDIADDVAWYESNAYDGTRDVKTKQPNGYELYDMSGNIFEWCWDWYEGYTLSSTTAADGPSSGTKRVYRSGDFMNSLTMLNVAYHRNSGGEPENKFFNDGFRVVRTATASE